MHGKHPKATLKAWVTRRGKAKPVPHKPHLAYKVTDQLKTIQMNKYRGRQLLHMKNRLSPIQRLALECHLRQQIKERGYEGGNLDVGALLDEADTSMGSRKAPDYYEVKAGLDRVLNERLPPKQGSKAYEQKIEDTVSVWREQNGDVKMGS